MKLIYPKQISQGKAETLRLCIAKSGIDLTRGDVLSAVSEQLASVEAGVQIIDQNFPVPKAGKVDLIACDRNENLLLINIDQVLSTQLISRTLCQADWIRGNQEIMEHFYFVNRRQTNDSRSTIHDPRSTIHDQRIWCLAGKILPEAESLLNYLDKNIQLEVFTFDCLVLSGEQWLVVRPFSLDRESYIVNRNIGLLTTNDQRLTNNDLTKEEIDDFFSEDESVQIDLNADEDEITYVGPYFE